MSEHYDASAPPPQQPSVTDDLNRLLSQDADSRLRAKLDQASEAADRIREEDRARDDELPDWLRDGMERISGADDAPLVFASLHRRVQEGLLTWESLYREPSREEGAMVLMGEVLRQQQEQQEQLRAALREEHQAGLD